MKKILIGLSFLFTAPLLKGQNFLPSNPLEIPIILSGTFSELRGNHFHGGIDIKTQGRSGLRVRAVADGYISRIAISPYGYGNALYIRHPEGYTSVYGHLNAFAPEIETYVENYLRERSKNDGNIYPDPSLFPVKREELIAFSGNTGGSMGPHLHFEIRETRTEEPLNPLAFGLEVKDTRAPNIRGLMWTDADFGDHGEFKEGDTIAMPGTRGFDVFTTDKQDLANNNNGVSRIEATANGTTFFTAHYDRINFSTSRFINAHINYERYYAQGVRYTRLYELENNPLEITQTAELITPAFRASKGWLTVAKDSLVKVHVKVLDFEGNESAFDFYLKGAPAQKTPANPEVLAWDEEHNVELGPIKIRVPKGALYRDTEFKTYVLRDYEYVIGQGSVPLQTHMELRWELDSVQRRGVGWFAWELGRKGSKDAITGEREGDILVLRTRSTGTYYLDQDLVKPTVRLVQSTPMVRSNSSFKEIRISAQDDKTGIDRYSARIDGAFARIDFDYKRDLLKIVVPKDIPAGNHNLRVVVIDGVGNTTVKEYTITL